ncbi:unnamed protein product, partial [Brassica oleracea var. botrytis]
KTFFFFLIIQGFPASRVIPLGPVRQRSTLPGRALPGLDRTQYRFGVQKRQGSFRMGRESNPDGGCHHRSVLPLGLPSQDRLQNFVTDENQESLNKTIKNELKHFF